MNQKILVFIASLLFCTISFAGTSNPNDNMQLAEKIRKDLIDYENINQAARLVNDLQESINNPDFVSAVCRAELRYQNQCENGDFAYIGEAQGTINILSKNPSDWHNYQNMLDEDTGMINHDITLFLKREFIDQHL